MTSKRQSIELLVAGELNMDLILDDLESFPELEKEKIAGDMNLTLGSSSAIFAANIARLGISTRFCGLVGSDSFGTQVISQLQDFGVETDRIRISDRHKTGLTAIIRFNNSRAMVTYPGAMSQFSGADIPDEAFREARHLHISSIFLQPGIKRDLINIVQRAKSSGMTVSIDPQWDPDEKWDLNLSQLLKQIDFFLPNEAEFLQYTKASSVEDGLEKLRPATNAAVIVKRGTRGATFLKEGTIETVPAYINEDPVDAVGAGDSFNAGFIYRFLKGDSIEQSVAFANLAGAVSTTQAGGTAAITSIDEVLHIANQKFSTTKFDEITR
ncbi:carbohydrate kinase family protein [Halalkalibaculum sp. DA3122]|uniref:carbohydrate kinase family protein n=1 Tax=Halalkalibaculum sp. DA3122 TaxID=3373607 RepID=UPI003755188B